MYFIYILYSQRVKNLYVGHTSNLEKRLKKHNDGLVKTTKNRRPLILIHKESYTTRYDAMRREKYLKSLYGSRVRKQILKNYLLKKSQKF